MRLENLLEEQKSSILKKWFEQVIQTYPPDTSKFLKKQKDPFANPLGGTLSRGLDALFDLLVDEWNEKALISALDPMVRIRAIQDFTPSQAVSFVFTLKQILRSTLKKDLIAGRFSEELPALESKIDRIGLLAFNIYMQCREKIYHLKAYEIRERTFSAFERAGLVCDIPGTTPDVK